MATPRKQPPAETMSETLRRAIVESGESYRSLATATGLTRASLQRFVDGRQSLRLDLADRLAAHYGLELMKVHRDLQDEIAT